MRVAFKPTSTITVRTGPSPTPHPLSRWMRLPLSPPFSSSSLLCVLLQSVQKTVTRDGRETELRARGRHDPCVVPRGECSGQWRRGRRAQGLRGGVGSCSRAHGGGHGGSGAGRRTPPTPRAVQSSASSLATSASTNTRSHGKGRGRAVQRALRRDQLMKICVMFCTSTVLHLISPTSKRFLRLVAKSVRER